MWEGLKETRDVMTLRKRPTLVGYLLFLMLLMPLIPFSVIPHTYASGESWLEGWSFRKSHEIEGSTEGAQTDYYMPIRVNYGGGEIYFADNGKEDPLYFPNYPTAVYYNGKTYIGWQGDAGYDPYIIYYDHATDAFSDAVKVGTNPLSGDSHGAPVILIDDSGYIHVFYGCHNSNLKYTKSDNPEDITAWTGQADPASGATYPAVIPDNGDIHLIYRYYDADRDPLVYKLSDDNGASWGSQTTMVEVEASGDAIYPYMPQLHGTRIHTAWRYYDASAGQAQNVYHAYLDLTDSHMYSMDGTDLGTSISKAEADANCMLVDSGNYDMRHMALRCDENGYPYIIYCIETATALDHRFIRWTGSAWTAPVTIAETDEALNAMDFIVHSSTSITAFLVGSGSAGRGGDIVKWSWNGATWTEVKTILSEAEAGMPLQDPRVVINYDDEMKLVFTEYGVGGLGDLKVYASDGDSLVYAGGVVDSGENVYCNGKCRTDFGDIRFRQGEVELEHWLEEKVDADYALFWVKIPNIPASPSVATIHVYYGKDDATSASTESREDFTEYTEVEEYDDIQKTAYHADFIDYRTRTTHLYKDYTADYFNNFAHHLNIKRVTHTIPGGPTVRFNELANVIKNEKQMRTDHDIYITSLIGSTNPVFGIREGDSDGNVYVDESTNEITLGTMYYQSFRKYGTALILDTYTTAAKRLEGGDGDFAHLTLTLQADYFLRYYYVGNTYNDGIIYGGSSDMEDLFFRKYVSPEPANGDWGTEEEEAEDPEFDVVDNNTSDIDSSEDKGTHSDFTNEQDCANAEYDILTEASGAANDVFTDGFEDQTFNKWEQNGATSWQIGTFGSGTGGSADPHSGSYDAWSDETHGGDLISDDIDLSGATGASLSIWIYKDDIESGEFLLSYWDGSQYDPIIDLDTLGGDDVWIEYSVQIASEYWISGFRLRINSGADKNENVYIDDVTVSKTSTNYQLDLEIQWTNANYTRTNEELCIKTGTVDAEDIKVDVWSGSDWINLLSDLNADSWNNVSVTTYLTGSTFTVRFKGGTETGDENQGTWQIDCVGLHTWEANGENNPPTNDVCEGDTFFDVDTYGWVRQTVTDVDGVADLKTVDILIITTDSRTFTLRWTQSSSIFSEVSDPDGICILDATGSQRVNIDSDTDRIEFKFKISAVAQKGYCSVQATVIDDADAQDEDTYPNEFTINFYVELSLTDGSHSWSGLSPGDEDVLITSPGDGDIDLTITTNADFSLQAKGDGALSTNGYTIPLVNVEIHKDTLGSALGLTTGYVNIGGLTAQTRGVGVPKSFKLWINVPTPLESGDYSYSCYVQGVEST